MISVEFLITAMIVVLIPGTGVLYTVATGLFVGRKASMFAALGCTLGILPSLLASIMGLGIVIHTSALAFQIIKYIGVAYLLYLAWSMLKARGALVLDEEQEKEGLLKISFKGFLINILNPKLTIFFLAFLPQFIPFQASQPTYIMLLLASIFMLMTLIIFVIYGLLATSVRSYIIQSEKVSTFIQRILAGSFAALGIKLALTNQN